jgi:uncharacterized protein YkwD
MAAQTQTFTSTTSTAIASGGGTSPYPAPLDVSGMHGTITHVSVKLNGLHFGGSTMDVMLQSPHGESVMLTSDIAYESLNGTIPFDDSGVPEPTSAPDDSGNTVYQPTDNDPASNSDTFDPPAPADPGSTTLAGLNGQDANGTWKLWIRDDLDAPGSLDGWSVTVTATGVPGASVAPASVDLGTLVLPGSAPAPQQTVTFTNSGDGPLTFNHNPSLSGANAADFGLTNNGCLGNLDPGASCTVGVSFLPTGPGTKNAVLTFDDNAAGSPQTVPVTGNAQLPPPTESGSPEIKVQSVSVENPVVGQPTYLDVTASDANRAITGLIVDFGETLGAYGESACVEGFNHGNSPTFHVPYEFLTPGPHTITITILAGGCGTAIAHTYVFTVDVAPAGHAAFRAYTSQAEQTLSGPPITSNCKNKDMAPDPRKAKVLIKALLCVMNEQRALYHLKPLKLSKRLSKAALNHTRAMVVGQFFAHQGPKEPPLGKRLKKVKYRGAAGENIGAGAGPMGSPLAMVNGWMHSSLHRANLLYRSWKTVGVGFLPLFPIKTAGQPLATYTTDFGVKP